MIFVLLISLYSSENYWWSDQFMVFRFVSRSFQGLLMLSCWFCLNLSSMAQTQGPRPGRPLPEPANPKLPTLYLIGDSTVRNGDGNGSNGQWGWGNPIAGYFNPHKINVVNRALGGLSSRTYLTFEYWDRLMEMLKPGDFVIMQFGHNDSGPINDNVRARGTIKGIGEETQEIDNILTGKHEVVHTYGWYLRKFIADTLAKARHTDRVLSQFRVRFGATERSSATRKTMVCGQLRLPSQQE